LLATHKKDSGKSYIGVYARMKWDAPSPTMTTHCYGFGNGRFSHQEQDRAISVREAATLQTLPKPYQFAEKGKKIQSNSIGRTIGISAPVKLIHMFSTFPQRIVIQRV